jgi:hypothetical protein
MEEPIKDLMKQLGEALNESLQDSEKVQKLLREMEEKGYSLTLSLAVIIGSGQSPKSPRRRTRPASAEVGKGLEAQPTPFDRKFLKALKIKIGEERS